MNLFTIIWPRTSESLLSVPSCVPYCLSLRVFEPSLSLCREAFERTQCFSEGHWDISMVKLSSMDSLRR